SARSRSRASPAPGRARRWTRRPAGPRPPAARWPRPRAAAGSARRPSSGTAPARPGSAGTSLPGLHHSAASSALRAPQRRRGAMHLRRGLVERCRRLLGRGVLLVPALELPRCAQLVQKPRVYELLGPRVARPRVLAVRELVEDGLDPAQRRVGRPLPATALCMTRIASGAGVPPPASVVDAPDVVQQLHPPQGDLARLLLQARPVQVGQG